jgi:hypothetical protein
MNLCLFETTSLYRSSKQVSQYELDETLYKIKLLTDSDFLPMMHLVPYSDLRDFVQSESPSIGNEKTSSKKLRISMSIISLTEGLH